MKPFNLKIINNIGQTSIITLPFERLEQGMMTLVKSGAVKEIISITHIDESGKVKSIVPTIDGAQVLEMEW